MPDYWYQTEDHKQLERADSALFDLAEYFRNTSRGPESRFVYGLRIQLGNLEGGLRAGFGMEKLTAQDISETKPPKPEDASNA